MSWKLPFNLEYLNFLRYVFRSMQFRHILYLQKIYSINRFLKNFRFSSVPSDVITNNIWIIGKFRCISIAQILSSVKYSRQRLATAMFLLIFAYNKHLLLIKKVIFTFLYSEGVDVGVLLYSCAHTYTHHTSTLTPYTHSHASS